MAAAEPAIGLGDGEKRPHNTRRDEDACPTSSSLASETLCSAGSSEAGTSDAYPIYSSDYSLDESTCSQREEAAGIAAAEQLEAWRCAFYGTSPPSPEPVGSLDLMTMIRHQRSVEQQVHPHWGFLDHPYGEQAAGAGDFPTPGMRMVVVSWMVEVAEEFSLQQETLHLATGLLDRFLGSTQDVPRCVLQLLAVACILLAAKDLEVAQPTVEQLCAVTANHFRPADLLRMERIVLDVLEFRLACPSSYTFLHLLAQACTSCVTPVVLSVAMYVCELAVLEYDMHAFTHSCRAAAALLLAQLSVGSSEHLPALAGVVLSLGVPAGQLAACMALLLSLQQAAYEEALAAAGAAPGGSGEIGGLLAPLRAKFGAGCWCEASRMPPLAAVPQPHLWAL